MLIRILTLRKTYIYISFVLYSSILLVFIFLGYNYSQDNCSQEALCVNLSFDDRIHLFLEILLNNEKNILLTYCGIFTFGLIPLISIMRNASAFGFILGAAINNGNFLQIFYHTFPHSFEVIVFLLACADSIYLEVAIFLRITHIHNSIINSSVYIKRFILYFMFTAIAALIETFISIN